MQTYAGIDLHSSNNFVGVINDKDKILYSKRHANRLDDVLRALDPFKDSLKGVVVESTFNWYWLVDGLQEHGYRLGRCMFESSEAGRLAQNVIHLD